MGAQEGDGLDSATKRRTYLLVLLISSIATGRDVGLLVTLLQERVSGWK